MNRWTIRHAAPALAVALLAACGPQADTVPEEPTPEARPERPTAEQERPDARVDGGAEVDELDEGRDLTELLVCELVPGEDVAGLLGGSLYAEPSPDTAGAMWSECAYLVLAPGTDTARLASVRLYGHEHFDMALTLAEQTDETFEALGGPGNEAFAAFEDPIYTVTALSAGDVTVETRVEGTLDEARELAELVLDRLAEL